MAAVFISYSRVDAPIALEVRGLLNLYFGTGTTFLDTSDMEPGESRLDEHSAACCLREDSGSNRGAAFADFDLANIRAARDIGLHDHVVHQ